MKKCPSIIKNTELEPNHKKHNYKTTLHTDVTWMVSYKQTLLKSYVVAKIKKIKNFHWLKYEI